MQNIEQVFLYMKDEITSVASKERQAILEEVKKLEEQADQQMKEEAKRDADLQMSQELAEISSTASAEISESHSERTKKLIEKRDEYVSNVFAQAKDKLVEFTKSADYSDFLIEKVKKAAAYGLENSVMYVREEDLALKDKLVAAYGKEITVEKSEDITIGGFIIENKADKLVINESLDSALEGQKDWFYKNSGLIIK